MIIALMDSEHFEFLVVAQTTQKAENLLNKAFHQHLSECGTEWEEDCTPTAQYGFQTFEVANNTVWAAFRDGERMTFPAVPERDPEAGYREAWACHNERFSGD